MGETHSILTEFLIFLMSENNPTKLVIKYMQK